MGGEESGEEGGEGGRIVVKGGLREVRCVYMYFRVSHESCIYKVILQTHVQKLDFS